MMLETIKSDQQELYSKAAEDSEIGSRVLEIDQGPGICRQYFLHPV